MSRSGPTYETSTRAPNDWRDQAACRTHGDPELWFPIGSSHSALRDTADAVQICEEVCPVKDECRGWALETRQEHGVWGGMTEDERKSWHRARARERHAAAKDAAMKEAGL